MYRLLIFLYIVIRVKNFVHNPAYQSQFAEPIRHLLNDCDQRKSLKIWISFAFAKIIGEKNPFRRDVAHLLMHIFIFVKIIYEILNFLDAKVVAISGYNFKDNLIPEIMNLLLCSWLHNLLMIFSMHSKFRLSTNIELF